MRSKPTFAYSGLTVVLSNPSRDDKCNLLTGRTGEFFDYKCLQPYTRRFNCDIRTSDTISEGLLPNTRGILLLGERAFREWTGDTYKDYSLGEQRGCPLKSDDICRVASYLPIDCLDLVDWEGKYNPLAGDDDTEGTTENEYESTKKHGKTARRNYGFWLIRDTKKLLARLYPDKAEGVERIALLNKDNSIFNVYPSSEELVNILERTRNETLYLDIETDKLLQLTCFGFAFSDSPVIYVVPITRWNYQLAYTCTGRILAALARALKRNRVVIHNSQFDLLVLAWKYKLIFGTDIYDTMLAQHKCFVDTEKSLGHAGTCWTWEEYHKDEGVQHPQNHEQERMLWNYNGKDIKLMRLIHRGQEKYASSIPGLKDSIELTNNCCYPFLLNTLMGIRYNQDKLNSIVSHNDRLCNQYVRMLHTALGKPLVKSILGASKAGVLASNQQCCKYFHDMLGYPVVKKSKKTGNPSLDADALYKLKLVHTENPIIDILLKLRERLKETSSLKFTPWKNEKGETVNEAV